MYHVHEDDEYIIFHLFVVEGDKDHENYDVNLFVYLGPDNDVVLVMIFFSFNLFVKLGPK